MWTQTLFPNLHCTTLLSGHHGGCVSGWHTYPRMDCIPNWTKWHFKNHIQHCDKEKNVWIWSGGYDNRPWLGWRPASWGCWRPASWGYCKPMFFSFFSIMELVTNWAASMIHKICMVLQNGWHLNSSLFVHCWQEVVQHSIEECWRSRIPKSQQTHSYHSGGGQRVWHL